jgi:hypothetical protein
MDVSDEPSMSVGGRICIVTPMKIPGWFRQENTGIQRNMEAVFWTGFFQ